MEEPLIAVGRWLLGRGAIPVIDEASVSLVRDRVRREAARVGLPDIPAAQLVNVVSELAHNQLAHARGGYVVVREAERCGARGLEVVAADEGPGIVDVARALVGAPSGGGSLGVGLAAVLELADDVDVDVRVGEGVCIGARKFLRSDVRARRVGVYGRACAGERTSGDDAAFARVGHSLVAALVDGLGHGEGAREAAQLARDVVLAHAELAPHALLSRCHAELARSRGAVMTVAQVDEALGEVALGSVGNVLAQLVGPEGARRFGGSSFVLGSPGGSRRVTTERAPMAPRDVLVLFTDGVSSRADLGGEHDLLREHPVVIAQRIVERFGRDHDDVTALVVA